MWTKSPPPLLPGSSQDTDPCVPRTDRSFISTPVPAADGWDDGDTVTLSLPFGGPPSRPSPTSTWQVGLQSLLQPGRCLFRGASIPRRTPSSVLEDASIYTAIVCSPCAVQSLSLRAGSSWVPSAQLLCILPGTRNRLANQISFLHRLGGYEAQSQICDPSPAIIDSHK